MSLFIKIYNYTTVAEWLTKKCSTCTVRLSIIKNEIITMMIFFLSLISKFTIKTVNFMLLFVIDFKLVPKLLRLKYEMQRVLKGSWMANLKQLFNRLG